MKADLDKKKKRKVSHEPMQISKQPDPPPNEILDEPQGTGDEKKEKRKKKRKAADGIEEVSCMENKKPKCKNAAGDESENNVNGLNGNEEEVEEGVKMSLKEANALSGKWLRKSLNSPQGPDALRKFLAVCRHNKERDLATDYLSAGGNLLEILRLLETGDKKNVNDAVNVFAAMHLIICKILEEFPQYRSNAEEACRHLINTRLSFVHGMLSSQSNAKHRKTVLQLLASMVSLGGNLPRELLAHLSFHSQVLETLSQHTKPSDPRSVRMCYIQFVLAFLVEDKPSSAIRALLDKRAMLSCIFSELMYDSHETVHFVLDTVKTSVLENPAISKTTKLHVFSTPVLQSIVSLYNWKGPKNWPGPGGKKRDRTAPAAVDPEEKRIAVEAVEKFLTTLLTSNRHGVIFHDRTLGTSGRKYNQLVNTVLQSLERPWEHPKPAELVIKIVAACPDLVRAQLAYTEPFIEEPRASKKWILAMRFVGRLIESIDPEYCLAPCLSQLLPAQLVTAVENLTMPALVLKSAISRSLDNEDKLVVIRHEAVCLLKKMLNRARLFSEVVEKGSEHTDWVTFRNSIVDYVSKNVPSLEKMLKVWNLAAVATDERANLSETMLEQEKESPLPQELIPSRLQHFDAILDLIEAHRELCPELQTAVDLSTSGELRSETILAGLEKFDETEEEEEKDIERMRIKTIRFLLSVDAAAFAPNQSLFATTLTFLLKNIGPEGNETESQRRETVKRLLKSCGLFEACQDEIDIWIENIGDLDNACEKNRIAGWFVEILEKAMKNADEYLDAVVEAEQAAAEKNILGCDEELRATFDQLANDDGTRRKNIAAAAGSIGSISPVVCSAIENAPKNSDDAVSVGKYLSLVLIEILHCQVNPGTLVQLTRKLDNFPAKKYLNSWLSEAQGGEPTCMKKQPSPPRYVRSRKLSKILLQREDENDESKMIDRLKEIFQGSRQQIEFVYGENKKKVLLVHDFDRYEIHHSLTMTIFYLSQLIKRAQLSQEKFNFYKLLIIAFLHAAKSTGGTSFLNKCSSLVFEHPAILQYFTPLRCPTNSSVEMIITEGMVEILKTARRLNDEPQCLAALFSSFKNKLLGQLFLAIEESKKGKRAAKQCWSFPDELMEIVEPTSSEVVDLLGRIINHLPKSMFLMEKNAGLSVWANLVPKLMEILTTRKSAVKSPPNSTSTSIVDTKVVKKIISHLIQFKSCPQIRMDLWEIHLQRYLECYPQLIAAVDGHAFNCLLKSSENTTTTINLITFLAGRNDQFILLFVKYICNDSNALAKSDLVFPVIANRLSYSWSDAFLTKIYNHYKNDLLRYFAEPEKSLEETWISGNIRVAARLIDSCFDGKDCEEARAIVLSTGDKLDKVDVGYVKLVKNLFEKSWKLENEESEEPMTDLIQVLMRITVCALKKDSKNVEKLETLCQSLISTIESLKSKRSDFVHEELSKNYSWPQFTRFSLKLGLKVSKEQEQEEENKYCKGSLLETLVRLCEVAYKDDSEDQYVKTLFEMTNSHSEFTNVMLSSHKVKRDLTQLILCLIRKNPGIMTTSCHIPLYLAAYNATLSEADQTILLILQRYRGKKIKFTEYRPYLWGEAAASHYSVKGEADTALWRQPSVSQVLDLFERHLVEETIKRFAVDRDLEPSGMCAADAKVYDPAFYLPLLADLFSDNNVVACHKVTQSGALALVFAALGSTRAEIRLAACNVLHRFSFHLEATSSKEKHLWIRMIDKVRSGLVDDSNASPGDFRPSCLVSTFLARAALVATQPGNTLYAPIQAFLMAKPSLESNAIPELLRLFHSSDVEHVAHRHWILRVIRDGMKTQLDMEVALKSVVFKMLLDFYSSLLADPTTKRLILEIIESTVKIAKAGSLLTRSYGLLAWLSQVSLNLSSHDAVRIIVAICREIFSAVTRSNDRDRDSQFLLLNVLKNVGSCMTKNTSIDCFNNYTSALNEIFQTKCLRVGLTRQDLQKLMNIGKHVYGQETAEIDDILDSFNSEDAAAAIKFSIRPQDSRILDDNDDCSTSSSIGIANLRKLVLTYVQIVK